MAQGAGRVVCPTCGANNYDTVAVCWKCNSSLAKGAPAMAPAARPGDAGSGFGGAAKAAAFGAATAAGVIGNPKTANAAAVWLGLLFPYFGLPIGLAFMMCDDRRRQEVGKLCLIWSIISTLVHLVLAFISMSALVASLGPILSGLKNSHLGGGGAGGLGGGLEQ